jgi:hypothetical protein
MMVRAMMMGWMSIKSRNLPRGDLAARVQVLQAM